MSVISQRRYPPTKEELEELYWDQGLSIYQIAPVLSISSATVLRYLRNFDILRRSRLEANRLAADLQARPADLTVNNRLAYLLGLMYGDGNICHNRSHYIITITPTKEEEAVRCKEIMSKIGLLPHIYSKKDTRYNHSSHLAVVAYSKVFFDFLAWLKEDLGNLKDLLNTSELRKAFWIGFYKAEGSLSTYRVKGHEYFRINIYNTVKEWFDWGKQCFEEWGFHPKVYRLTRRNANPHHNPQYTLYFGRQEDIQRFIALITEVEHGIT